MALQQRKVMRLVPLLWLDAHRRDNKTWFCRSVSMGNDCQCRDNGAVNDRFA
jgi:hypothetical protein